ncbi:MAG: TonB-dependent receptor [Labilithrix sp.]|nr:TonB-dependent receptor [Labilithrix sp.]
MLAVCSLPFARRAHGDDDTVVVTGTRTPESSQRATVKVDVVTREEAERRGATNVGEALSSQPGVQVNPGAYGYLGGPSAIQIQGFDLQRVLVLEDGEPVVGDIGGAIDLASVPTADLSRIEIVTGPTSALYGSSAIGGVVNILTAPPRRSGPSGHVRLEGRSYRGLVLQANAAYREGRTWARLDTGLTRQDGLQGTPGLPDLQVPATSRFLLGPSAGTSLGERVDVRVRARWLHDTSDGLSSQVAPGLGRYLVDQPATTDRFTVHVVETVDLGRGSNLRLTLGRQWVDGTTAAVQRGSSVGETHERSQRMQSLEGIATVADGPRTWVVGTRAQVDDYRQSVVKVESLASGLMTSQGEEVEPRRVATVAPYGQLQWRIGRRFTVLPGLRGETSSRYGSAVTPRLALAWRPAEPLHVRVSGGRGFRAPSAKELGFTFDHSAFGYRVLGAPDLRPETSWGANADVTVQPARELRLRAGTFANWVDDLIDVDLARGSSSAGVTDYTYRNFGRARTFGGSADAALQLGDRFRAEASYDYLWTRNDVEDVPLTGRPPHTVTASLRGAPLLGIEGYARVRVVTDAYVSPAQRSPAMTTIDLRASHALWPGSSGYVGVLNLADQRQEAGRVGDLRPPLGRVFYVGLRAELPWEDE